MNPKTKKNLIQLGFILCLWISGTGLAGMGLCVIFRGWSATPNWPLWMAIPGFLGCIVFALMGGMPGMSEEEPEEPKLLKVTETYGEDDEDEEQVTVSQE